MSDADEETDFASPCPQDTIDKMRHDIDDQRQALDELHSLVRGLRADMSRELMTLAARIDDMGTAELVAVEDPAIHPSALVVARETDAIPTPVWAQSGKTHTNGFYPLLTKHDEFGEMKPTKHHELGKMKDKGRMTSETEGDSDTTLDLDGFVAWYEFTRAKWTDIQNEMVSCNDALRSELLHEIISRCSDKNKVEKDDDFLVHKSISREELEHKMSNYNATSRHSRFEIFHNDDSEYTFQESVWDLGMFVWCPELGMLGSINASLNYIINTAIVIVFCGICQSTLVGTADFFNEDSLDGLGSFRETLHSHSHFNTFFGLSLAYRVCNEDEEVDYKGSSLMNSNTQLDMLSLIENYLGTSGDWTWIVFGGRMLAVMALTCWFLTVFVEIRDVLGAFRGMLNIPHTEGDTIFEASKAHGNRIMLKAISRRRLAFCLFVLTQRLAIAFALFYSGGKWLAHTSSVESLLLNAAALEIVFSTDEMLFKALATDPNKKFLSLLHPVTQKKDFYLQGLDLTTALCAIIIPSCVATFYFIYVVPMVDRMHTAVDVLCGRDLRWTYGLDTVFGLLWTQANSEAASQLAWGVVQDDGTRFAGAPERMKDLIQGSIDTKVAENLPAVQLSLPLPGVTLGSLDEIMSMPFETMVETLNPGCGDLLQEAWTNGAFTKWVQVVTNNSTISSCEDLKMAGLCLGLNQPHHAMRLVCSETCGCSDPLGPIYAQTSLFGCASKCTTGSVFKNAVKRLPFAKTVVYDPSGNYSACLDQSVSWLTKQEFWQVLGNGLLNKADSSLVKQLATNMSSKGCDFLADIRNLPTSSCDQLTCDQFADSFCNGDNQYGMRQLSTFCPFACKCHEEFGDSFRVCPSQCSQNFYWDY